MWRGRFFNAGTGVSLLQLAANINELTGQQLEPLHEPVRPGDIRHSQADIAALHEATGYVPNVSWREGFRQAPEFYGQQAA